MANKVTFRKNGSVYCPMRNGKLLKGTIESYYSWYSHSYYYRVNHSDKAFGTLKEAKEYFIANMEAEA